MKSAPHVERVRIVNFAETGVAVYEHRGDPRLLGDSIRKFIEWRKRNHLSPGLSATFNILYDNPAEVAPAAFRLDLCAATERDVADDDAGVVRKTIPGGRCAVLRHVGCDDTLGESIRYLCADWFPQSGECRRDFPVYLQRVRFVPEVTEREAVTDVFLPLRMPDVPES